MIKFIWWVEVRDAAEPDYGGTEAKISADKLPYPQLREAYEHPDFERLTIIVGTTEMTITRQDYGEHQ